MTEEQSETSSGGLERDLKGVGDTDAIVPVIISMGDNSKRSVTMEVPLEDIVKGASCTLEGMEHIVFLSTALHSTSILGKVVKGYVKNVRRLALVIERSK